MHNPKPKKRLGQHFLTDKNLAIKIVSSLKASENDEVVEIGPGKGILTQFLLPLYPHLRLVEIDQDMVEYLKNNFPETTDRMINIDILKWNIKEEISPNAYFIGNLPYNISSPIFFKILENSAYVKEGVFMIQKEVAERICSPKGVKSYGILSVLMGYYYELSYEFSVPPQVFRPPPEVMSGVLRMTRREDVDDIHFPRFKHVVKTAFGQRRKTLRNALRSIKLKDFPDKDILLAKRAEQLSIEEFVYLTKQMEE